MSNIYIKEPPTDGKVLLHTSMGDVDVELFSKEAPLACRNFVQLCMEEYYNSVIFHRIVPKFIVQGGDPTGTGDGGDSIYGKPFKDEFHQRLRFVRRGLVGMANAGPDDNGSQFFFTLGPCNDLNKKHTIFGKVTGDTIYNLVRLGEVQVENDDQPINPPFIKWTKVLANPFDDIEPRVSKLKQKKSDQKKNKQSKMKATKDFKLLSFGDEAEVEERDNTEFEQSRATKSKSSHDLTNDPKLSSMPAVEINDNEVNTKDTENASIDTVDMIKNKLKKTKEMPKLINQENMEGHQSKAVELKSESRRLAREIIQARKRKKEEPNEGDGKEEGSSDEEKSENPMFDEYKNQQKKYKKIKKINKETDREKKTLSLLEGFKTKMFDARKEAGWNSDEEENDQEEEILEEDDDSGWILHKLGNRNELRDAKDMNREVTEDRFDISDPRNPLNKRRRDKDSKTLKDKHSY